MRSRSDLASDENGMTNLEKNKGFLESLCSHEIRIENDMVCSLLCFMDIEVGLSSNSCNLIYFTHLRKIPFPIFRFLFRFRCLKFRLWMTGFRMHKLQGNKMDFLQTTICEVSGKVSWTGKDDLEPGSVELHHLYP